MIKKPRKFPGQKETPQLRGEKNDSFFSLLYMTITIATCTKSERNKKNDKRRGDFPCAFFYCKKIKILRNMCYIIISNREITKDKEDNKNEQNKRI